MDKVLVQWTVGRLRGTTSLVKRSAIKEGTVVPGEEVKFAWGKSKKSYNAEVLNVSSDTSVSATHKGSSRSEEKRFSLELVAAVPRMSAEIWWSQESSQAAGCRDQQQMTQLSTILEKLDCLANAVSGVEARLLHPGFEWKVGGPARCHSNVCATTTATTISYPTTSSISC